MTTKWAPAVKKSLTYKAGLGKYPYHLKGDYKGDGFGTRGKSLKFMQDPIFDRAWEETAAIYRSTIGEEVPDVRWRAHVAIWAARNGLALEGDFVECGVFMGTLAQMICRLTEFGHSSKKFWLCDTWTGVPVEGLSGDDLAMAETHNKGTYHRHNVFDAVQDIFKPWPSCNFVRGILPQSLESSKIEKIAYLSVDLNNSVAEKSCIEALWPKLTKGAIVVIDDYGWTAHRVQQDMWDNFAASKGLMIVTLPTGQGLLIRD
jgi:hypothetical protein